MSYYTSIPILFYTIYVKFLHENYLNARRALKLIRSSCNHSAVFDVRHNRVLTAPKDNGGLSCVQCISLDGNPPCQPVLYHKSQIEICVVNTFAVSQLLAFCGSRSMQSYKRKSMLNNSQ